uniref:(northern house mosquito) hypothetical protein n=1 Tax=Culex pipiens TaxID=7175 RepID=A0A8D8K7Q0_CULPI
MTAASAAIAAVSCSSTSSRRLCSDCSHRRRKLITVSSSCTQPGQICLGSGSSGAISIEQKVPSRPATVSFISVSLYTEMEHLSSVPSTVDMHVRHRFSICGRLNAHKLHK